MKERLELIIKKYPTCDECDIRHTCGKMGKESYICDMLKEIEKELNIE